MDFAADNDLRVIDCKALLEEREQGGQNNPADEHVMLAQAIEENTPPRKHRNRPPRAHPTFCAKSARTTPPPPLQP